MHLYWDDFYPDYRQVPPVSDYFYRHWQSDTNMPQFEQYDPFVKDEQYLDDLLVARVLTEQEINYIYEEFSHDYREQEEDEFIEIEREGEEAIWDSYIDFNDRSSEAARTYSLFGTKTVNVVDEETMDAVEGMEWGPPSDYEVEEEAEESLDLGVQPLFK